MSDNPFRQCYICLDTEEGQGWVSPCRCSGTLAWVHRDCLLRWVREHESDNPGTPTACPQCLTMFVLMPEKGPVVTALEVFDKKIYPSFKMMAFAIVGFVTVDAACTTVGALAMVLVHGLDDVQAAVMADDLVEVVTHLHVISYSLLFVSYLPWEDVVLNLLRRASRLPILGKVLPSDAPTRYKVPAKNKSVPRIIVGSILLPACAKIVGEIFFRSVESSVNRVLLGGVLYLAIKGGLYMYYQQKLMMRRKLMIVLPFEVNNSTLT